MSCAAQVVSGSRRRRPKPRRAWLGGCTVSRLFKRLAIQRNQRVARCLRRAVRSTASSLVALQIRVGFALFLQFIADRNDTQVINNADYATHTLRHYARGVAFAL